MQLAQHIATVALNLASAITVGAGMSALWLAPRDSGWAASQRGSLCRVGGIALAVAVVATVAFLLLETAEMAEVPITEAGAALWPMLTDTHFGFAWTAGAIALLASALALALQSRAKGRRCLISLNLFSLAAFLYTRSMVSHASADGDFSIRILSDWTHLVLISVWVGEVFIAAFLTLAAAPGTRADDRGDCKGYVKALSTSATYALGGIVATGLVNAWFSLGSPGALFGTPYGAALLVKLALVGIAVLLGGLNRFFVMPTLVAAESFSAAALRRFRLILRVEAAVLSAALIFAAILSSTPTASAG